MVSGAPEPQSKGTGRGGGSANQGLLLFEGRFTNMIHLETRGGYTQSARAGSYSDYALPLERLKCSRKLRMHRREKAEENASHHQIFLEESCRIARNPVILFDMH